VRVGPVDVFRVRDGGLPVLELAPHRQQLARFAAAGAEVPVVDHQAAVAGGAEALGECVETLLAGTAKSVRHGVPQLGGAIILYGASGRGRVDLSSERRFFAASRRRTEPRVGLVLRRGGGGGASASRRMAAMRSRASERLRI